MNDFSAIDLNDIPERVPRCGVRLENAPPLLEKLWNQTLWEIERNYALDTPDGTVFAAADGGKGFLAKLFNRDVSYAGLLGLNDLYPQEMLTSLKAIRKVRFERGWSCPESHVLQGIPGVTVEPLDNRQYILKYGKSTPLNKTDDVVWLWCAFNLLLQNQMTLSEWQWLYESGVRSFETLYDPFFDAEDGLYFGQPTFIDVGSNGYPMSLRENPETAWNQCVWVKASSTNALYYAGLRSIAAAARKVGHPEQAERYQRRADALAESMRMRLRFEDGTFAYFLHRDGHPEPRREVMGTALPVLLGIVSGEDARCAVKGYPYTVWGAPLIYPYFENDEFYHNNSAWPFASTFLNAAAEKADQRSTALENLMMLMNAYDRNGFREVFDMRRPGPAGCVSQLWTLAAFVNTCDRLGFTPFSGQLNLFDETGL